MRVLDSLRFRIATLFRGSEIDAEMEEELRSHIQHRADDLERSGLDRAEAERRARIEFGGQVNTKRNATTRWATISSRPSYRMCASAFVCCASLPDSHSPRL